MTGRAECEAASLVRPAEASGIHHCLCGRSAKRTSGRRSPDVGPRLCRAWKTVFCTTPAATTAAGAPPVALVVSERT